MTIVSRATVSVATVRRHSAHLLKHSATHRHASVLLTEPRRIGARIAPAAASASAATSAAVAATAAAAAAARAHGVAARLRLGTLLREYLGQDLPLRHAVLPLDVCVDDLTRSAAGVNAAAGPNAVLQAHTCCSDTLGACEQICCRQCGHTRLSDCSSSRRRHAAQNVWPHGKSSVGRRSLPLMSSRQIPHLNARARAPGSGARKREGASEAPRLHCGDHAATALL